MCKSSREALSVLQQPADRLITGFVYETTPGSRKPVQDAAAWLDLGLETYVANTETDEAGHFYFCRVNTGVWMYVFKEGYQGWSQDIPGTADMSFEIELKR
jgi:hypothetical protein